MRVIILVVTYNAEKTIAGVLSKIPVDQLPPDSEVLVIDDGSPDTTYETALANKDRLGGLPLTVLFNPSRLGYGTTQKLGFQYAIQHGFDIIALLHGDGKYAPEILPELIEPVLSGEVDACFGSRMLKGGTALKSGMPLIKFIGNRLLSYIQNCLLRTSLSEFHSGYRVYRVAALRQIPFKYNTDDYHFDTEIIIQLIFKDFRIGERAIPAYSGEELTSSNGFRYAWNVIKTTLAARIHRMGLFFHPKYDVLGDQPVYDIKLGYESSHTLAISLVSRYSTVLDLTCGTGYVAQELKKKECLVTGIDKISAKPQHFSHFIQYNLDEPELPPALTSYDYILALDCVEHLDHPERFVAELRSQCYADKTVIIFTVPNLGFFITRLGLLFGQFNYGRQGILDLTHKRLFTFSSFERLLHYEGYILDEIGGIAAPFPKALGNNKFSQFLVVLNHLFIRIWQNLFSYQIYVIARFQPPIDHLLACTVETSQQRSSSKQ